MNLFIAEFQNSKFKKMFINFTFIRGQESENKLAFRLATYCSVCSDYYLKSNLNIKGSMK